MDEEPDSGPNFFVSVPGDPQSLRQAKQSIPADVGNEGEWLALVHRHDTEKITRSAHLGRAERRLNWEEP